MNLSVCVCLCPSVPPNIMGEEVNNTVLMGQSVQLHCQSDAIPPPALSWRKDGRPLYRKPGLSLSEDGSFLKVQYIHQPVSCLFWFGPVTTGRSSTRNTSRSLATYHRNHITTPWKLQHPSIMKQVKCLFDCCSNLKSIRWCNLFCICRLPVLRSRTQAGTHVRQSMWQEKRRNTITWTCGVSA